MLVEIMVAVVLLSILVGSIAAGATGLARRGRYVDAAAAAIGATTGSSATEWEWSDACVRVSWLPGPLMEIRLSGHRSPVVLGVWLDGWSVLEGDSLLGGEMVVGPRDWDGRFGDEVVVRVRTEGGAWSPPWRTLVPGSDGASPLAQSDSEPVRGDGIVLHPPMAGNPAMEVLAHGTMRVGPSGLPLLVEEMALGAVAVRLDGLQQSWLHEAGRSLDVYF